jgi:hypothetical protein
VRYFISPLLTPSGGDFVVLFPSCAAWRHLKSAQRHGSYFPLFYKIKWPLPPPFCFATKIVNFLILAEDCQKKKKLKKKGSFVCFLHNAGEWVAIWTSCSF